MTIGQRHFQSFSHVGELRKVVDALVIFYRAYGADPLGYLDTGDVFWVVSYDWESDELQVLTRLGVGWIGPAAVRTCMKVTP
jgi:hypothetical protein